MRKGWTLLIPSGPRDKNHLFFVLNNPKDGEAVLACLSSMHQYADRTCIVNPGDHPFIRHKSFIDYRHCRTDRVTHLTTLLERGYIQRMDKASDALVERILKGAKRSEHTKQRILDLLD